MTGLPVLEIELLWIVSLFNQDLVNTCQIHQNTPIACHRKFQPDECIWKSTLHCIAYWHFPNVTFTRRCVDPSLAISSLPFPSCPILTKHQAFAPSGPMTLNLKSRLIRAEFCFRASANAWQETHDLRNTMKHAAHTYRKVAKCFHTRLCFSNWPKPPPTGKKTIRFWPLSLWTLKNLKFFQKHVQIISDHVFKIRLEAIIISPQSVYQVLLLTHISLQFCCTSSWVVLHPKTWNLDWPQKLFIAFCHFSSVTFK